ncbi:glycosyltransferase [Devosia sp. RR2S18]|uniref:glycosyltransferase n=1 Tax=Devosia rhizosphaerae TaxID=3049774 RepID=UPI0025423882|nr:glycosyltransferase [Devosia sp. RR2S18]WIJ24017.1 glycosyltransferase [Devosia sp. RR2S18]
MLREGNSTTSLYHDYFAIRGGGERLALELACALDAELVYGYRTELSYGEENFPADSRSLMSGKVIKTPGLATIALAMSFAMERRRSVNYPVRIFSGVAAPFAAPKQDGSGVNIFYCHTPPRFLYDQKSFYEATGGVGRRLGLSMAGAWFQRGYERSVGRMDMIVANSENIRRRIKRYLGRDSVVVYPPVDTEGFRWEQSQGYYLSTARLTPLKRIRTIVEAFKAMPDLHLVVASGGEQEDELKALAAGVPNIRFTGWTEDAELKLLVARAVATIYIPVEEDFGMSPVESMAAGKPVIGVAEGGLLETVVPGQTGFLLPAEPSAGDLQGAVRMLTPDRALEMRVACEQRAQLFTRERFLSGMSAAIAQAEARKLYSSVASV